MPCLLLFLAVGMFAGSEGVGGIEFDSPDLARKVGTAALLVILFTGGLDTNWSGVKPVLAPGFLLATGGVLMTTLLLGSFAWFVLGTYSSFSIGPGGRTWIQGVLLASIVSSTGASAVFSSFQISNVEPVSKIRHLLEFESGSNNPRAAQLSRTTLRIMTGEGGSPAEIVLQLVIGVAIGIVFGVVRAWVVNRLSLSPPGLCPILVLAVALLSFGLEDGLGGRGFLAAYAAEVVVGNRVIRAQERITGFHDGLTPR